MKLYGMQQSRSFRALWALEESALEYDYIPVTLRTDGDLEQIQLNKDPIVRFLRGHLLDTLRIKEM